MTTHRPRLITLAHGAGGKAMQSLIDELFLSAFADDPLACKEDQARVPLAEFEKLGSRLAFTTDSFVVTPLEFPGGDIGTLAVCGTVNDLAVGGAKPLYLSVGFIIEEGMEWEQLERIVQSMAFAARQAGVKIVTGDTKVVERGKADKLFINTSGVGVIADGLEISVANAQAGDRILINGHIGDHGAAVMLARGELGLSASLQSDCAALNTLIQGVLAVCPNVHAIRDATRGGLGAVLDEIAEASQVCIEIREEALPVRPETQGLCDLLGLEPLFMANEGLAAFVVPQADAEAVLAAMRAHPLGRHAEIIGQVTDAGAGRVVLETGYGAKRMLDVPYGMQLPRIC